MQHFPIFLDTRQKRIVVSGAGQCALAKLRIILKTEAEVFVFGDAPLDEINEWERAGRLTFTSVLERGRPRKRASPLCCK